MDPVLVDLVFLKIYWYSIIVMVAFFVGGLVAIKEARKHKINDDYMVNFIFFVVPIALLGARIYYIVFNWAHYKYDLIGAFRVWEGGLAIHGGILFGFLWLWYFTKKNNIRMIRFLDIVVPGLLIGQAIGRWGNFFNQEAYGPVTSLETLQSYFIPNFIIEGMYINGAYHHPTFLYEFIWCTIGFLVLVLIRKTYRYLKIGQLTGLGLIWLGSGRYFIEGLRTDSLMFESFKVAQVVSVGLVLLGLGLFFFIKKGSRFENLYSEEESEPSNLESIANTTFEGGAVGNPSEFINPTEGNEEKEDIEIIDEDVT